MTISPFRHFAPAARVLYGDRCLEQLAPEITRTGAKRAVVFTGRTLSTSDPGLETVKAALGDLFAGAFTGVVEQSPLPSVEAAVATLREHQADALVVLGAGSAVVTARAAAIVYGEGKTPQELCTVFEPGKPPVSPKVAQPKIPQFVIPTSPTTAYSKSGAGVSVPGSGLRLSLFDPKARAHAIFFHPGFFMAAPARLIRDAGLDTFAQGVQGLESKRREPLADAMLLHGVRLIRRSLPRLDDVQARGELMLAAQLIGEGTDYTGAGMASSLGHVIGPRFNVSNGLAKSVVLPHTIRFNAPATQGRLDDVAAALGLRDPGPDVAESLAQDCARFYASFELPSRLRDLGIAENDLLYVVEEAMNDWFFTQNPRPVSGEELLALLKAAW